MHKLFESSVLPESITNLTLLKITALEFNFLSFCAATDTLLAEFYDHPLKPKILNFDAVHSKSNSLRLD